MSPDPAGYLALVLHAHLPFVRHLDRPDAIEERWLFEAITESYLPLLGVLRRLEQDGIAYALTLSLSPTLLHMLSDGLLQERYLAHLERCLDFAEQEVDRAGGDRALGIVTRFYREFLVETRHAYSAVHGGDLVTAFRRLQEDGCIEILACAATHGYLPLLRSSERSVDVQIGVGAHEYERFFGRPPRGMWLPECGYYAGLDVALARHGVEHIVLERHGLRHATPRAALATYAPVVTPSGLVAFGRDLATSRQVWSAADGYPGHPDYRDFHRDVGYDLDIGAVQRLLPASGVRVPTGFKYHRVTGPEPEKELYDPARAGALAREHARDFVHRLSTQLAAASSRMDGVPVVTAPYDAELFGHWWFEGPQWLDGVLRLCTGGSAPVTTTLGGYLDRRPALQEAIPATSSWGESGYHGVWLSPENDWIYPEIELRSAEMSKLARGFPDPDALERRALAQAAREILLAQSSDWAFLMSRRTAGDYAAARANTHLSRFADLNRALVERKIDQAALAEIEAADNLFPEIDYRAFLGA